MVSSRSLFRLADWWLHLRSLGLLGLQSTLFLKVSHTRASFRASEIDYVQETRELLVPRILTRDFDLENVMAPGGVLIDSIAAENAFAR